MYASYQYLSMYRSTNKGVNWAYIAPPGINSAFNAPFLLAPSNPKIIYAGDVVVYKSTNAGSVWTAMNNGNVINGDPVLSIAVSYTNPDSVYVTTAPTLHSAAVFLSTNGGVNWTNITGTLPDRYPVDISVDPSNSSIVYIAFSGFGTSHLFRSSNGGNSWNDIGLGLPDVPTSAVCIDLFNSSTLYVGNDLGVYYSFDNGNTWNDLNSGIIGTALVMDLAVSPVDYKIVVATHGRGVYKIPLSSITPVELIAFNSQILQSSVLLNWTTATEINNYGFEIQRSSEIDSWRTIGFVNGHGTSQVKNNYTFKDYNVNLANGVNISYRLKQNDFNGKFSYSNIISVNKSSIPDAAKVSFGTKDFEKLSSGIYLYKLSTPGFSAYTPTIEQMNYFYPAPLGKYYKS